MGQLAYTSHKHVCLESVFVGHVSVKVQLANQGGVVRLPLLEWLIYVASSSVPVHESKESKLNGHRPHPLTFLRSFLLSAVTCHVF
jgi:hypothetical protein